MKTIPGFKTVRSLRPTVIFFIGTFYSVPTYEYCKLSLSSISNNSELASFFSLIYGTFFFFGVVIGLKKKNTVKQMSLNRRILANFLFSALFIVTAYLIYLKFPFPNDLMPLALLISTIMSIIGTFWLTFDKWQKPRPISEGKKATN